VHGATAWLLGNLDRDWRPSRALKAVAPWSERSLQRALAVLVAEGGAEVRRRHEFPAGTDWRADWRERQPCTGNGDPSLSAFKIRAVADVSKALPAPTCRCERSLWFEDDPGEWRCLLCGSPARASRVGTKWARTL
jgi:hypothetical protein